MLNPYHPESVNLALIRLYFLLIIIWRFFLYFFFFIEDGGSCRYNTMSCFLEIIEFFELPLQFLLLLLFPETLLLCFVTLQLLAYLFLLIQQVLVDTRLAVNISLRTGDIRAIMSKLTMRVALVRRAGKYSSIRTS